MGTIPSSQEIIQRAVALQETIRSRAPLARKEKNLPRETIQDLQDAGFFKILQPARYGGYEMDPWVFFQVQLLLAQACMSTGWVYGVLGVHPFQLGLFDDRAQKDIWGEDPSTLASSTYQPVGKVTKAEDGFRLSGRWEFSSGCEHCSWVLLGAIAPDKTEMGGPDVRTFLLPKSDYQIVHNWETIGLEGTGSHDIVVDDVFVPTYRTHRALDGAFCKNPGNKVNKAPLYKIPWAQIFVRTVSSGSIGATESAIEAFKEIVLKRVSKATGAASIKDPRVFTAISDAMHVADGHRLLLKHNMAILTKDVKAGDETSWDVRLRFRYDSARVTQDCMEVLEHMVSVIGGQGIRSDCPVTQAMLDVRTARAHAASDAFKMSRVLGEHKITGKLKEYFI